MGKEIAAGYLMCFFTSSYSIQYGGDPMYRYCTLSQSLSCTDTIPIVVRTGIAELKGAVLTPDENGLKVVSL
jgi:hypothetical protein